MAVFETWLKADLKGPQTVEVLSGVLFSQDNLGNKVGVIVTDGGSAASLSGTVTGYIVRSDGNTVTVNGTLSGNRASITLPSTAYAIPGPIKISIKLTTGSVKTTLGSCIGVVYRSVTGSVINGGTATNLIAVPDLPASNGTYSLKVTISNGTATYSWA